MSYQATLKLLLLSPITVLGNIFNFGCAGASCRRLLISGERQNICQQIYYSSVSQSWSSRHPALHVFHVSLLQHTWFKWMGRPQPSAELKDLTHSFESGVLEQGEQRMLASSYIFIEKYEKFSLNSLFILFCSSSCHWVKGGVHPGWVISWSQKQKWDSYHKYKMMHPLWVSNWLTLVLYSLYVRYESVASKIYKSHITVF